MRHRRSPSRVLLAIAVLLATVSGGARHGAPPDARATVRTGVPEARSGSARRAAAAEASSSAGAHDARAAGAPRATQPAAAFPPVRVVEDRGVEIADGELLLVAAAGREDDVERAARAALPVRAVRRLAHTRVIRVRLEDGAALAAAVPLARSLEGVEDASTNAVLRGTDRRRARLPARAVLWNVAAMHVPARAVAAPGRATHVIALLDSGVAYGRSPGLARAEIVAPLDVVDGDADPQDENGHGTFLANLLVGAPGLAPGAALMPVRVLDASLVGTEAALIEGLAHARAEGADVVNLSLVHDSGYVPTRALDAAIAEALAAGVVIVAAAGNDGAPQVRYPAAFPGVVAVGASTPASSGSLARAPYSSHGAALDVLAPGGDLESDRNRDGWPDGILAESFDPTSDPHAFEPWLYAGTSQAAAHASAAAVLLLQAGAAPASVPARLRESGRGGAFDPEVGGGFVDVAAAIARRVALPVVGARALLVLRDRGDGTRSVAAPIALRDADDRPVARATVHGRLRGVIESVATCTTDRDGACVIEVGPLAGGPAVVGLEIEAVVLRDGRAVRPATLATALERDAAGTAVGGTGFGSSSTLWTVGPDALRLWPSLAGLQTSYVLFGSGASSALAPTAVVLDAAAAARLVDASAIVLVAWRAEPLPGGTGVSGGGFGSSSSDWLGYSFTWSGWGSPIYSRLGAFSTSGADLGRVSAR